MMRYKGSTVLALHEQRFILAGDFVKHDGTGSAAVYSDENNGRVMTAEKNTICKF